MAEGSARVIKNTGSNSYSVFRDAKSERNSGIVPFSELKVRSLRLVRKNTVNFVQFTQRCQQGKL